jgi:hypothetical protein
MPLEIPLYQCFEQTFDSARAYGNPAQDAALGVTFTAPSGKNVDVDGFWDGGNVWRVRFRPDEAGEWSFTTACSDPADAGLHDRTGAFRATGASGGDSPFQRHGPLRLSDDRRHLAHANGTPFLWLADTAWYGPMLATDAEWGEYVRRRAAQGFTAVQCMASQWYCCRGDRKGRAAFTGRDRIAIDPTFFQNLDAKLYALNDAGLLAVVSMLWVTCYFAPDVDPHNPGVALPEDQAILLGRYMRARWGGAHEVAWILCGDGPYGGERADRWKRIGRGVFGDVTGAPGDPIVMLHPFGGDWPHDDFRDEPWIGVVGYQSGHACNDSAARWLVAGRPANDWQSAPARPYINLEPPYEDHLTGAGERLGDFLVRRALYWSLLVAPTAGVTYGGHGVWSWEEGGSLPFGHGNTGIPLPWREALELSAARQITHLRRLFLSLPWHRLRPAPGLLAEQPGEESPQRHIAASLADDGSCAVIYIPSDRRVSLRPDASRDLPHALWFDPRAGGVIPDLPEGDGHTWATPAEGDWVLLLTREPNPLTQA